tara:strand:+ start:21582 stop:22232 length:651 start_codon:yes stop_codon:yes gene_type:complete
MDWFQSIDFYCERVGAHFWAEPVNALSNIGFIAASFYGFYRWWGFRRKWLLSFACLSFVVGCGSFLFHTFANRWSHLADIIPIAFFMVSFLFFTQKEILKFSKSKTVLLTGLFLVVTVLAEMYQPRHILNGSLGYLPAFLTLLGLTYLLVKKKNILNVHFQLSTLLFAGSLFFRTLDNELCDLIPLGTHWLWHLLNSALLANLMVITYTHQKLEDM